MSLFKIAIYFCFVLLKLVRIRVGEKEVLGILVPKNYERKVQNMLREIAKSYTFKSWTPGVIDLN